MSTESQWDFPRWRDAGHTPRYDDLQQQHPQLSATQPTHQPGNKDPLTQPWYGRTSHDPAQQYTYDSRRQSQTYNTQQSHYAQPERHAQSGDYGPPNSTSFSNNVGHTGGPWRENPSQENVVSEKRFDDGPLSLQIPHKASELPNIAHGYTTPRSDAPIYSSGNSSWSHHTTSLPSFAALSEQAKRPDEPDEVEIAPMSARLPCTQCAKLGPMVREVAAAFAELDGYVQSLCCTATQRTSDIPRESVMRTVQWILDRLSYTKNDMQDAIRNGAVDQGRQQLLSSTQYSNPLKRTAELDQDDMPTLKLPRPNPSHSDAFSGERRTSIDFAMRDPIQRSAYSPAPSDSAPGSAYPRHGSPISGRLPRALPSPSSLAYPSGAGSFVPANAGSIGSPGTSYHPASSIHTVSTNSATSAHLQDLQHQISLKSLSMQTLQAEYASLLQKLQRERIKSQTIEKKTSVADQEVNDLTTRNEELSEQIKTLETQLQECERKRESERADAAKEKEQWGRMLDMGARLQNKITADSQRLTKEKADLSQRLAAYEKDPTGHRSASGSAQTDPSVAPSRSSPPTFRDQRGFLTRHQTATVVSSDVDALRRENGVLQAQVTMLRSSLEEFRRQYSDVEETIQHLVARRDVMRKVVDRTAEGKPLDKKEDGQIHDTVLVPGPAISNLEAQATDATSRVTESPSRSQAVLPAASKTKPGPASQADLLSRENLAHIARAVSPGPAELGFHVQPSTSSPEELIKALGPIPAPLPPMRFSPSPFDNPTSSGHGASKQRRRQSQPFVAPSSLPHESDGGFPQAPSFRALNHHMPSHYQDQPGSYYGALSHSHHSSPGPNLSNTSSPGSTSTHSPEYRTAGSGDDGFARRHSQPHLQLAASPSTAAMPPPPRPLP